MCHGLFIHMRSVTFTCLYIDRLFYLNFFILRIRMWQLYRKTTIIRWALVLTAIPMTLSEEQKNQKGKLL